MKFDSQHVQQNLVFFKTPRLVWGPPSLSLNWFWGFFPMESVQVVKLATHPVLNQISSHPHFFVTSSLNSEEIIHLSLYCQHVRYLTDKPNTTTFEHYISIIRISNEVSQYCNRIHPPPTHTHNLQCVLNR